MKRMMNVLVALLAASVVALGLTVVDRGSFYAGGATSATAKSTTIAAQDGLIRNVAFCLYVETNASVTIYRPHVQTEMRAAASASTNVFLYTDYNVKEVSGFTPTVSDFLLIRNASSGFQLAQITTITTNGVHTNSYLAYGLSAAVTCSSNDVAYIADADNNVVVHGNASFDQTDLGYLFTSFRDKPVHINIPATAGACLVSGTYDVER